MSEFFSLSEPTWSRCPRCNTETGSPPGEVCWDCRHADAKARELSERMKRTARSIPEAFGWAKFGAPEMHERVKRADLVASAQQLVDRPSVVLRGPAGHGKTSLAIAMLRAWCDRRDGVALFLPATRLSGGRFELDDELLTASLVLIDDVGTERQMANNLLPELVYERHARDLALWVTTWMSPDLVSQRYGDGIARRIFERAAVIDFAAPARGAA